MFGAEWSRRVEKNVWVNQSPRYCRVIIREGAAGQSRVRNGCTRKQRCVISEQEGAGGWSRMDECPPMHKRVWMYHFWSRRLGHSGGVPINAPEGLDV
jgi:hypothetical protein